MSQIHPLAVVSPRAEIGRDVVIGPFCVVEGNTTIGDSCILAAGVTMKSGTRLGPRNEVCEGAVLGGKPQHKRVQDPIGELHIGCGNLLREHVTIHRGMHPDTPTLVGDHNMLMVNSHIAHDCRIGNHCIFANNVMLAGHVTVGDHAYLSGAVGIHQFCRVGQFAMLGGQSHISQDVPPFVTVDGQSSTVVGLNLVGLRRAGFSSEDIGQLKQAYRVIYRGGMTWAKTLQVLGERFREGPAAQFLQFMSEGKRGFVRERRIPRSASVAFDAPIVLHDERAPQIRIREAG